MILTLIICAVVVITDQLSKYAVVSNIAQGETVKCIDGVFHLTYVRNEGAAFGMLSEHRWVFMAVSVIAIASLFAYLAIAKPKSKWERVSISMIIAGGIGNMIDRTINGYVVDFIEVEFVDFAVFNVADSFVTVACGILIVYLIVSAFKEKKAEKKENENG